MREIPLVFSTESVNSILSGAKTQTRRVMNPQPASGLRQSPFVKSGVEDGHGREMKLRFAPGDRIWVRETWALVSPEQVGDTRWWEIRNGRTTYLHPDSNEEDGVAVAIYQSEGKDFNFGAKYTGWRSPVFMPRWASRITLEVTEVRVQRLADISYGDCIAEGIDMSAVDYRPGWEVGKFKALWDTINGKKHPWDENCFVWAITFQVLK